jgi:hypothetical protein
MTTLATAAQTLCAGLKAQTNIAELCVWSQVDQFAVEVDNGWIDNAFDTQRRRGQQVSTKTLWNAP